WVLGIFGAIVFHLGILLFGGLFFMEGNKSIASLQEVELVSDDTAAAKEKEKEKEATEKKEDIEAKPEQAPDASEIIKSLETPAINDAPALDAASLGAIEQALNGQGGGGDFGEALSFGSGGRIGGHGKGGALDEKLESAFDTNDVDQKPRAVYQPGPLYP